MAVAKIQGPMLQTNLVRYGIDFAVETDLLYFDVGNDRIGIKTSAPGQSLEVVGGITVDNLSLTTNAITSLNTDGDITLTPDGTGSVIVSSDLQTSASTTTRAGLNIPEAIAAPTVPADGDVWITAGGAFNARLNGATVNLAAVGGTGDVSKVGTPVNNEIGVWTGDGTIEGDTNLTWDGSTLTVGGLLQTVASDASSAGINIAEGVAPTVPVDGDVWVTAAGEFNARLNGATVDLSAGTAGPLGDLTDVTFTTEVDGEILRFNGADWINNTLNEAGISRMTVAGSAPGSPNEGDHWLNSTTQEVSIYANSIWEPITYKTELAADAGALTLNGGNF